MQVVYNIMYPLSPYRPTYPHPVCVTVPQNNGVECGVYTRVVLDEQCPNYGVLELICPHFNKNAKQFSPACFPQSSHIPTGIRVVQYLCTRHSTSKFPTSITHTKSPPPS